jgi:crotonobetainyl-CoA:carnitine CoA-transferase CaiB-like acyl-CoA transferase
VLPSWRRQSNASSLIEDRHRTLSAENTRFTEKKEKAMNKSEAAVARTKSNGKAQRSSSSSSLTEMLQSRLSAPATSPEFDLYAGLEELLSGVGLSAADSGGKLTFYGQDPIVPSCFRFGAMAAIALAAKAIALAALWKSRTGEGQDIHVDVRKALRRFCCFFEGKWETINGRPPAMGVNRDNPFFELPLFRKTRDGRHVVALNLYPRLHARALNFLRCSDSPESVSNAILQWRAEELEAAAAEAGIVIAMVRTNDEFRKEPQYTDVLSTMPLIALEKIGESEPLPFKRAAKSPLEGIRAFGMGHVIAGAGIGRDLAYYGADVLNIWRPDDTEVEAFAWDVQVGMRSTILDGSKEDRAKFNHLLKDADVFFSNRRPGYLERYGLTAEELSQNKPGLIHVKVVLHGERGPWSNWVGFDEIGAAVSGLFSIEGTPTEPKSPPIIPICDNVVGWLGTIGVLEALRRRATEGGSYRVVVSLTRTVLWLLSMGIFDKAYARETAGSSEEHTYVAPDLFIADTPLGRYQGVTEQVQMSRTPGSFRTVLVPRGSSNPEWLES